MEILTKWEGSIPSFTTENARAFLFALAFISHSSYAPIIHVGKTKRDP